MRTIRHIAVVAALMVGAANLAFAAAPTQADFDACNMMALSKAGNPSASPQGRSQTGASTQPSGRVPQAAPNPERVPEARVANQADQLRGIADEHKDDVTYQQAYRDCMKSRGF
jgi:hypothetical protein